MATNLSNTTFSNIYKDDFSDSDNYHRILFNGGKALQARELTQSQTIIQKEIERLGSNIFLECLGRKFNVEKGPYRIDAGFQKYLDGISFADQLIVFHIFKDIILSIITI